MQMVKKTFVFITALYFGLVFFMPKEALFFALEKQLSKYGIEIEETERIEQATLLELNDVRIYFKEILVSEITKVRWRSFLIYNDLDLKEIEFTGVLRSYFPEKIEELSIRHSVIEPKTLRFRWHAAWGDGEGTATKGSDGLIRIVVTEKSKLPRMLKYFMRKEKEGWVYDFKE